jgi:hypothetical protein
MKGLRGWTQISANSSKQKFMKSMKLGTVLCALTILTLSATGFAQEEAKESSAKTITCTDKKSDDYVIRTLVLTAQADGSYKIEMNAKGGPLQEEQYKKEHTESTSTMEVSEATESTLVLERTFEHVQSNGSLVPLTVKKTISVNMTDKTAKFDTSYEREYKIPDFTGLKSKLDEAFSGAVSPQGAVHDSAIEYDNCTAN